MVSLPCLDTEQVGVVGGDVDMDKVVLALCPATNHNHWATSALGTKRQRSLT